MIAGKLVGGSIALVALAFSRIDPSLILVLVGVAVYAAATWRRDTREILRRQNEDLTTRNATLEAENAAYKAQPSVDSLYAFLVQHDHYSKERDDQVIRALENVVVSIAANTEALRFWASQHASNI